MNELVTIEVKVLRHIKQFYIDEAKRLGQKTGPYTSLLLTNQAIANGAVAPSTEPIEATIEVAAMPVEPVETRKKVPLYNELGDVIGYK